MTADHQPSPDDLPATESEPVPGADDLESAGEDLLDELAEICEAVEIESAAAFTFAEQRFDVPGIPGGMPGAYPVQGMPAAPASPLPLIGLLRQVLYDRCYCRRFDPDDPPDAGSPEAAPPARDQPPAGFIQRLFAAAGDSGGRMDASWQVVAVDPRGQVTASKNGLTRVFPPGCYTPTPGASGAGPAGFLRPGGQVAVWLMRASLYEQAGFFYVHSETLAQDWDAHSLLRIYWNLSPEGALAVIGDLVPRLDLFRVPFQLKTLTEPESYGSRSDGTVLFFQRRHLSIVARLCLEVAAALDRERMPAATPLFTRPLAPGLALAEDPGTSFGISRCQALAEALWNAHHRGQGDTVGGQLDEVRRHFARRGVDLEHPHLNPGSAGLYQPLCIEEGP